LAERTGANNSELRPVILAPKVLKSYGAIGDLKEVRRVSDLLPHRLEISNEAAPMWATHLGWMRRFTKQIRSSSST
jgi:hypothetical protein